MHRHRVAAGCRRRPRGAGSVAVAERGRDRGVEPFSVLLPELLETVSKYFGIDMDKPWSKLTKPHQTVLLEGTGEKKIRFGYKNQYGHERWYEAPFEGVVANLQRRYDETQSEYLKQELERYMSDKPCPACKGMRLKPESLAVTVADRNIAQVARLAVSGSIDF